MDLVFLAAVTCWFARNDRSRVRGRRLVAREQSGAGIGSAGVARQLLRFHGDGRRQALRGGNYVCTDAGERQRTLLLLSDAMLLLVLLKL